MTPETAILLAAFAFFLVIAWAARTAARRDRYAEMKAEGRLVNRSRQ